MRLCSKVALSVKARTRANLIALHSSTARDIADMHMRPVTVLIPDTCGSQTAAAATAAQWRLPALRAAARMVLLGDRQPPMGRAAQQRPAWHPRRRSRPRPWRPEVMDRVLATAPVCPMQRFGGMLLSAAATLGVGERRVLGS